MRTDTEAVEFWGKKKVCPVTSMSSSGLDRAVASGGFPKPVRLSRNRVAWVAAEVRAWMEQRIAQRDRAEVA